MAKRFWTSFNIWLSSALDLEVLELTPNETALGLFSDESSLQKIVPFLFLVARNHIHCCKWTDTKLVLNIFKIKVKQKEKIEKINALVENKICIWFIAWRQGDTTFRMFVLKMYVQIMSLYVLLCNVCVCYVYILIMSIKNKKVKK